MAGLAVTLSGQVSVTLPEGQELEWLQKIWKVKLVICVSTLMSKGKGKCACQIVLERSAE